MLRLFQSIFGNERQGSYPESLVREAIERAVDGTDPWLRGVSGYRKKLRPAVIRAIDHVVALVDALPPPVPMSLARYTDDRLLKNIFISAGDMKQVVAGDRSLVEFRRGEAGDSSPVVALLAMEKQERVIFGAGLSGDIVVRDIPMVTVSFEGHRFLDPAVDEAETRRLLKRRAFDHLLSLGLKRLSDMKSERQDLERRRALQQSKLNLLEREGWGFDNTLRTTESGAGADVERQLGEIEQQLRELGGDDRMLDLYLEIVAQLLGSPDEQLWMQPETVYIDRMGVKRQEAADDAPELALSMLCNAAGRCQAVMLVSLKSEELRELLSLPCP
jgi:hypothetical protein